MEISGTIRIKTIIELLDFDKQAYVDVTKHDDWEPSDISFTLDENNYENALSDSIDNLKSSIRDTFNTYNPTEIFEYSEILDNIYSNLNNPQEKTNIKPNSNLKLDLDIDDDLIIINYRLKVQTSINKNIDQEILNFNKLYKKGLHEAYIQLLSENFSTINEKCTIVKDNYELECCEFEYSITFK